jgi:Family of unknown function (DUF6152)
MKNRHRHLIFSFVMAVLFLSMPLAAHHGSAISYDMDHPWTTKATVTEFKYANPHPWLSFDRVNDKGETEHWTAELVTNPTFLLRAGWTKSRSLEALKYGTVVELTLATSRVGGFVGCIRTIKNEKGDYIVTSGGAGGDGPVLFPAGRGAGDGTPAGSRGRE